MGRIGIALGLALTCGACGSGGKNTGGSGGNGGSNSLTGDLNLLSYEPRADAVQVALDATIRLGFDGAVVEESLQDAGTWLGQDGSTEAIPGTFAFTDAGRGVVFTPLAPLAEETDYTMHVSPLTADSNGRILEREVAFSFRTLDHRPPAVAAATVAANATGVSRTEPITITFREPLAPATVTQDSVYLRDVWGGVHPVELELAGAVLHVQPRVDLPGSTPFVLAVRGGAAGVEDRAGNAMTSSWSLPFTTAADTTRPSALSSWPNALVDRSPAIQPVLAFDESVDPASVEPGAIQFTDQFGSFVSFTLHPSPDQKALRLRPTSLLTPGRTYTILVPSGVGAITDVSGNTLVQGVSVTFGVGSDASAPALASSVPGLGADRISLNVEPVLTFDEALDAGRVDASTVRLLRGGEPVAISVTLPALDRIQVVPAQHLAPNADYVLRVTGGHDGVRDLAGNPLAADLVVQFRTANDASVPAVILQPPHGSIGVPLGIALSAVFDQPMDPVTVNTTTVRVRHGTSVVPGTLSLLRGDRVIRFEPTTPWSAGEIYSVTITGGPAGVREASGNWLADDQFSEFRIGHTADLVAPAVSVTLNGIDDLRKDNLTVPRSGFTIDVTALDPLHHSLDAGSFEVVLTGTGAVPDADAIFAAATVGRDSLRYRVPRSLALATGEHRVVARVKDLNGNVGASFELAFKVDEATDEVLPFERTHVVWTRIDLDRDGNLRSDFEDDLVDLGLIAAGDPRGTNARMIQVVRDGILAQTNVLLARAPSGASLGDDSVAVRLTWRRPLGIGAMQIALGGRDPEGPRNRNYGDDSTGVLGRAWFDYRNSAIAELNTATRPGLGVFPGEMFLYQAKIHRQVYPSYITTWARRFLSLSPHLNGTPAGAHALDGIVLAPGFDYANAPGDQRARYNAVFLAADEWATAIGTILAHEIGHSVGLVAQGPNPTGLHGDASLHDLHAQATDVMASAVGYESLVTIDFSFRDLNLAYLRQRVLMK